jgi:signal transduction histidine kinase
MRLLVVLRPRQITVAVASAAALFTLAVSFVTFLRFAYRGPELHIAIESASGVIAGAAAFLVVGRFRRDRRLVDLVLAWALGIFAATNLFLSALPVALLGGERSDLATWGPLMARLAGSIAFAAAAFAPPVLVLRARLAALVALGSAAVVVGAAAAIALLGDGLLPEAVDPAISPADSTRPLLAGDASVVIVQLLQLVLYAAAAIGFTRRAERTGDELLRWLAAGAVLASFARVNYVLFPSLYSDWVYTGDALRLGFYLLLLGGAAREVSGYWRTVAQTGVLEERRRIARDLHDGLAQELAFISAQTRLLAARRDAPASLALVNSAADRALGEARRAIAALTRPLDEPLGLLLEEVGEEVATRSGLKLELSVSPHVRMTPGAREDVIRIVREGITNAARHAHAATVRIDVDDGGGGVRISIADDGVGFDPAAPRLRNGSGFGLQSMRERVAALGGELGIDSAPGRGTRLEITFP